jgi:regulator of sirC expression with transglutaminase-like and TPR domain
MPGFAAELAGFGRVWKPLWARTTSPRRRRLSRVVAAFVSGRTEKWIEWATRLTQASPDHPSGWRYRAAGYAELDRSDDAKAALHRYLRAVPDHAAELSRITSFAQLPGLKERLITCLRKAKLPE